MSSAPTDYAWLTSNSGYPPIGRRRLSLDAAEQLLVGESAFHGSPTRAGLWRGLEEYLGRFIYLEDLYASELNGRSLIEFLWLGGSFVSQKFDPNNIDVSVAVNLEARNLLKGRRLAGWLVDAFSRDRMLAAYGVSPLEISYVPVASVFDRRAMEPAEREYLEARGSWDDWWQRLRDPSAQTGQPTTATVEARRGYLEVTL
ncbi:DUF6932 family protein [Nocardioides dokdonensis]|uniref:DUF6932 family protein n=1 Tax=Nocardioides dokdonensis TaxID=450734 RepID=UPI0012F93EB6|nr:hypothetical protein [Nocardioides dokdonensis]